MMLNFHKIFRNTFPLTKNLIKFRNFATKKNKAKTKDIFERTGYTLVHVKPNDYQNILDFWWKYFVPDDPLMLAAEISHKFNPVLDESIMKTISEGLSLMVICRHNGFIASAAINGTVSAWDAELKERLIRHIRCPKVAELLRLYAFLNKAPGLYKKYCQLKIFECTYLVTRRDQRGFGLATKLMQASHELCRDMAMPLFRVDCTSEYSSMICKKLGYQLEYELPYKDYKDKKGRSLYFPPPPHKVIRVYVDFPMSINCLKRESK